MNPIPEKNRHLHPKMSQIMVIFRMIKPWFLVSAGLLVHFRGMGVRKHWLVDCYMGSYYPTKTLGIYRNQTSYGKNAILIL